jgi:START domain-containing protein
MSKNSLCLALLTSIFIFSSVSVAEDWELRKDKESILVYTRNVDESKFQEFKGITKIKTSLNSLVTLLEDTSTCKNWVYKCLSEETIKTVSLNEKFIYLVSDASPLKNRDAIIHVTRTQDPKTKKVTYTRKGVPDFIPEKKGMVRVPLIDGLWTLEPVENNYIVVTYQLISDPGGNIPSFLANYFVIDAPFETLLKLRSEVENRKYQDIRNISKLVDE